MFRWLVLAMVLIAVNAEEYERVGLFSIPHDPPECTANNCQHNQGGPGYIIYGAEKIEGVCTCKITTWDVINRAAVVGEELRSAIAELEKRIDRLERGPELVEDQ